MPASLVDKTYFAKTNEYTPEWFVVDGDHKVVGRFATKLAMILMGKHKPTYTPHVDCGDVVIVLNADKVRFSGQEMASPVHPYFTRKTAAKTYETYSGYPSGRRIISAEEMFQKKPEKVLQEAVRRMLPKNKLGRQMLKKLKLYTGTEHPHQAQMPKDLPEHWL